MSWLRYSVAVESRAWTRYYQHAACEFYPGDPLTMPARPPVESAREARVPCWARDLLAVFPLENAYNFRELVRAVMKHRDPDAVVRSLAACQLLTQGLDRAQRFDEMLRLAQDPDQ